MKILRALLNFRNKKPYISTISKVILANAFSAIIVTNKSGKVIEWNNKAESLFGWTEKEAQQTRITHLIIPRRYHSKHILAMKEYIRTGTNNLVGKELTLTARHKDGYEFTVAARINHVISKRDSVFVFIISDRSMEQKVKEEQKVYASDLNCRIKALMSLLQSITKQTLITADPEEIGSLLSRMFAMDKAINILYQTNWRSANIYSLVYDITYIYGNHTNFIFNGDNSIEIEGNNAISFALIVHELCANSVKFGALKKHYKGVVSISWHIVDNSLVWHWVETGGPLIKEPPADIGFGMQFAKRAFASQGTTIIEYLETGISCTIVLKREAYLNADD